MKLVIERAALLRAISHVRSVVERRNTIPILSNVLLKAEDGRLRLAATDMDIEVSDAAPAQVAASGETTAPADKIYEIVRKLREGAQIELEQPAGDRGSMALRSGRSFFTLPCLPAEDYPIMRQPHRSHEFELPPADLKRLIDHTSFAISTEETRYYLNGIFLETAASGDSEVLRAVATDGHRLARVDVPLPEGTAGMPSVIIPRKTIRELRRLLDETEAPVRIHLSETLIRFDLGDCGLTSKLIEGTYPDYARVIPTGNDKVLEIECETLIEVVDRVSSISTERSRAIRLGIDRRSLTVSARGDETSASRATEELDIAYHAAPIEIGFNSRYLLDILRQIDGDSVQFVMAQPDTPTLLRDASDHSALYVLMPMRG